MRVFYHNARKLRQLHSRLKKAHRLLNERNLGEEKYPTSIKPLLVKIKKLVQSIGYLPKFKVTRLATFSLVLSLAMNVNAQQFLAPKAVDYNLEVQNSEEFNVIFNHQFIDVDNDGDLDCFYEYAKSIEIFGSINIELYFQENLSDAIIKFGEPQLIFNAFESEFSSLGTFSFADLDNDGDYDLYHIDYFYDSYNSSSYFKVYKNVSNEGKDFEFEETISSIYLSNLDISIHKLEFSDIDMDGDQDIIILEKSEYVNPYINSHFLYLENNGIIDSLFPFNAPIENPFNLNNVLLSIANDSIKLIKPFGHQLLDIDNDGDSDLIIDANKYYNYYSTEFKIFYFENTGDEQPFFDENMQTIYSWPTGTDLSNPTDTTILNTLYLANFQDLDKDGDLDGLINSMINSDSLGYSNKYYILENIQNEANRISGNVFLDLNSNGIQDSGEESGIANQVIHVSTYLITSINSGEYKTYLGDGDYTIYTQAPPAWNVVPEQYDITIGNSDTISNLDFAFQPIAQQQDLKIDAIGFTTRRGFDTHYTLKLRNLGTTIEDAEIVATFDEDLAYLSSDLVPDLVNGNTITWTIDDFAPFQTKNIEIDANVTLNTALGDTLCSVFSITPDINDIARANNIDTLKQIVTGSFDPNDKLVQPLGVEEDGAVPPSTDLFTYTIRFQNTGTDTAFTVFVVDTIDADLDLNTFEMVAASHDYTFEVNEERQAIWTFSNILLPDSSIDLTGSNGYIQYDIKPVADKPLGTQFTNSADIYFDFNDPVKTNTTVNTFRVILGLHQAELLTFDLFPNPTADKAILQFENPNQEKALFELYDLNGRLVVQEEVFTNQVVLNKNQLANGLYTFVLKVGDEVGSGKVVFQ